MLKFGRDVSFFDLLNRQAQVAEQAAAAFLVMIGDMPNHSTHARNLMEIERKGDDLTHQLQNKISGTFITPVDQEDLSELSHLLDDITDLIEATAARIEIYRLSECRPDLHPMVQKLIDITALVTNAVSELRGYFARSSTLKATLVHIHTVENESDELFRSALQTLFDHAEDPITVMKWKEIYDRIETATDRCEDVAKVLDNMIVKYA